MKIEITQEHINRAIENIPLIARDEINVTQCCPVYQAVSEALNDKNISCGWTSIYENSSYSHYNYLYNLDEKAREITALQYKDWKNLKPTTIELIEIQPGT